MKEFEADTLFSNAIRVSPYIVDTKTEVEMASKSGLDLIDPEEDRDTYDK